MNRAIARQSSPIVVSVEQACHAGGRGFESRRSRKSPCKSAYCVARRDARTGRLHERAFEAGRNGQKRRETRFEGHDFKPFAAASEPSAKAACDYTEWPAVKALSRRRRIQQQPSGPPSPPRAKISALPAHRRFQRRAPECWRSTRRRSAQVQEVPPSLVRRPNSWSNSGI